MELEYLLNNFMEENVMFNYLIAFSAKDFVGNIYFETSCKLEFLSDLELVKKEITKKFGCLNEDIVITMIYPLRGEKRK